MNIAPVLCALAASYWSLDTRKDIPYVSSPDAHLSQKLDLYLPDSPKDAPVLVYVHGGSWRGGDKSQVGNLPSFFTSKGWILASINYRLSPEFKHPAHVQDVAKAVAWTKSKIAEFGGNPKAIFVGGHSAGAHLVALLGTDEKRLKEQKLSFKDVRGIVAWDTAAHDLPPLVRYNSEPSSPYRQAFGDDPAGWSDASPLEFAGRAKGAPPLMAVLAGGAGIQGKRSGTKRLVDALRGNGVRADFVDASSFRSHQSLMADFAANGDPVAPVVFGFLDSILAGKDRSVGIDRTLQLEHKGRDQRSQDERIGDSSAAYLDPEFLQSGNLMAFADQRGTIWAARIDPVTGLPVKADAREYKIADGLSKWSRYSNGPEWGEDRTGPGLFFLLDDDGGKGQIWRASPPWSKPKLEQLTRNEALHHWIAMPSVDTSLPSTRLIAYRGSPQGKSNRNVWLDEASPSKTNPFAVKMGVARFAYASPMITWAPRQGLGSDTPQVHVLDTTSGKETVVTDDPVAKVDPWLWCAPEFDGEPLLAVNLNGRALGIYRDEVRGGKPWRKIAEIKLPPDAPHKQLKSIEPINGGKGAFGRSYFTVQTGDDGDVDTSIWLFGFSKSGNHLVQRLDDGQSTGEKRRRLDPESLVGIHELFVYYSLLGDGPAQLRLVRTGVKSR